MVDVYKRRQRDPRSRILTPEKVAAAREIAEHIRERTGYRTTLGVDALAANMPDDPEELREYVEEQKRITDEGSDLFDDR